MLNWVDVLRWFYGDLNLDLQGLTIQSMAPTSGKKKSVTYLNLILYIVLNNQRRLPLHNIIQIHNIFI
jgi:hypothetical protein